MGPKIDGRALLQEVRAHCESTGCFPRNHHPGENRKSEAVDALITAYREYYIKTGHYPKLTAGHDGCHLANQRRNFLKRKTLTPAQRKTLEEMDNNSTIPACEHHQPSASVDEPMKKGLNKKTTTTCAAATEPLSLPGLTIQWPFSQLILANMKNTEVRRYALGYRNIALANQEYWIIETPAKRFTASSVAVIGDAVIAPNPKSAQIVGVVSFSHEEEYSSTVTYRGDEASHRIKAGSPFDWNDQDKRFAWRISSRRRLVLPVRGHVKKSQTGFSDFRTYPEARTEC